MELTKEHQKKHIENALSEVTTRLFLHGLNQETTRAGGDEKEAEAMTPLIEKTKRHKEFLEKKLAEFEQ